MPRPMAEREASQASPTPALLHSPSAVRSEPPGLVNEDRKKRAGKEAERQGQVRLKRSGHEECGQGDGPHRRGQGAHLEGDPFRFGTVTYWQGSLVSI